MMYKLDKGYSNRGAFLGRTSYNPEGRVEQVEIYKVRLDSGGYDVGGAYWGLPNNLFVIVFLENDEWLPHYIRATSPKNAFFMLASKYNIDASPKYKGLIKYKGLVK